MDFSNDDTRSAVLQVRFVTGVTSRTQEAWSDCLWRLLVQVEEGVAVEGLAVEDDGGDAAGVPDVGGGI